MYYFITIYILCWVLLFITCINQPGSYPLLPEDFIYVFFSMYILVIKNNIPNRANIRILAAGFQPTACWMSAMCCVYQCGWDVTHNTSGQVCCGLRQDKDKALWQAHRCVRLWCCLDQQGFSQSEGGESWSNQCWSLLQVS